nr:hypothetical protein B0A51_17904 [Rachicladosporium sp. CCFEE 5018]
MFLALMTSLPAGNFFWLYHYGMPVQCIWQNFSGNYRPGWRLAVMVIGMIMQIWAILIVAHDWFPSIYRNAFEEHSKRRDSTRGSYASVTDHPGLLADAGFTIEPQHLDDNRPAIDRSAPAGSGSSIMRFLRGPRRIDTEGGRSIARTTSIYVQVQSADHNGLQMTRAVSRGAHELQPLPSTLSASLTPLAPPMQGAAPAAAQSNTSILSDALATQSPDKLIL